MERGRLLGVLRAAAATLGADFAFSGAEGERLLFDLLYQGRSLSVWVRPAGEDEGCFARGGAWAVGYRGEAASADLDVLRAAARALEDVPADPVAGPPEDAPVREPSLIFGTDQLEVRVTLRCNERCVFCNSWQTAENLAEDMDLAARLLIRGRELGARKLVISGGEPLLADWVPDLAGRARELGFEYVVLQTNGLLPAARRGWERLARTAPDEVLVSLHGVTPETVEAVTGRAGTFPAKLRAVRRLLRAGFRVVVSFVACRQNLHEAVPFVEFAAGLSPPLFLVSLSFVAPSGLAWENRDSTIPRMSDAAPSLLAALRRSRDLGLSAVLPEYCGIPVCMEPALREFADPEDERRPIHVPPDKTKLPRCEGCDWDSRCSGIFRRYLEMHGDSEFGL